MSRVHRSASTVGMGHSEKRDAMAELKEYSKQAKENAEKEREEARLKSDAELAEAEEEREKNEAKDRERQKMSPAMRKAMNEVKEGMTDNQKAYALQKAAKLMMDCQNYADAIDVLSHAIDCHHATSFFQLRARCYKSLQKFTEAYFDYSFAIRTEPDVSDHYVQRGNVLIKLNKLDIALEDFNTAVELDYHVNSYYNRGQLLCDIGKIDEAIADFNKAYDKDGKQAASQQDMQAKILYRRAYAWYTKGDMLHAISDLSTVLSKDPNNLQCRLLLCRAYKSNSELLMAEENINYVIVQDGNEPRYHIERGDVRFQMKENEKLIEAIYDFDTAIKILNQQKWAYDEALVGGGDGKSSNPGSPSKSRQVTRQSTIGSSGFDFRNEANNRSQVDYLDKTSIDESVNQAKNYIDKTGRPLQGAAALDIDNWKDNIATAHHMRAQAKLMLKHNQELHTKQALKDIRLCIKLYPDNEIYHLAETIAYMRSGNFHEALTSLEVVLQLNPVNERALFHRSFCHRRIGKVKEAIEDLSMIINEHHNEDFEEKASRLQGIPMYRVFEVRGSLLHELKSYKLALADFGRALGANIDSPKNYFLRGDCHFKLGNYELALHDFMLADAHGFQMKMELYQSRGQVYRNLGNFKAAEADFDAAMKGLEDRCKSDIQIEDEEKSVISSTTVASAVEEEENDEEKKKREAKEREEQQSKDPRQLREEREAAKKAKALEEIRLEKILLERCYSHAYFDFVRLRSLRALSLMDYGDFKQALPLLKSSRSLLKKEEEQFEEFFATVLVNEDELEKAYASHKRLEWSVLYHLALCLHSMRKFEGSYKYLSQCLGENIAYSPDGVALGSAFFFAAMSLNIQQRFVAAEGLLDECLKTSWVADDTLMAMARFSRGKTRQGLGQHTGALEDFTAALINRPDDPFILFRRGWSHKALGNLEAAANDFENAKRIQPHNPNFTLDYKRIRDTEYMCLEDESDFVHKMQSLLPIAVPVKASHKSNDHEEPVFFQLDSSKKSPKPNRSRFSPVKKQGEWASPTKKREPKGSLHIPMPLSHQLNA